MTPGRIIVHQVSKRFRLRHEGQAHLKDAILNRLRGRGGSTYEDFEALRDVSLRIEPGESWGLIGVNGSGKSSLLKMMAGIYDPDDGVVQCGGRVAAMLELGAGFHPELTGLENIELNSALLGFSRREIRHKIEEIVTFAELERYIDQPVKTYSSGMYLRLGFSVAVTVDPDILLIDEVLAVGDQAFQQKCKGRIKEFQDVGKTLVIVSHDLSSIKELCSHAALLHRGGLELTGSPPQVAERYHELIFPLEPIADLSKEPPGIEAPPEPPLSEPPPPEPEPEPAPPPPPPSLYEALQRSLFVDVSAPSHFGTGDGRITAVTLRGLDGQPTHRLAFGEPCCIDLAYLLKGVRRPIFGLGFHRIEGVTIAGPNTQTTEFPTENLPSQGILRYSTPRLQLHPGRYALSVALYDVTGRLPYDHLHKTLEFEVVDPKGVERHGLVDLEATWSQL